MTSATNIFATLLPAEPSAAIPGKPAASADGGFEALVVGAQLASSAPKAPGAGLATAATDIAASAALALASTMSAPIATGNTVSTAGATETATPSSAALATLTGNLFDDYQGVASAPAHLSGAAAPSETVAANTANGLASTAVLAEGLLAPAGEPVVSGRELIFSTNTSGTGPFTSPASPSPADPAPAQSNAGAPGLALPASALDGKPIQLSPSLITSTTSAAQSTPAPEPAVATPVRVQFESVAPSAPQATPLAAQLLAGTAPAALAGNGAPTGHTPGAATNAAAAAKSGAGATAGLATTRPTMTAGDAVVAALTAGAQPERAPGAPLKPVTVPPLPPTGGEPIVFDTAGSPFNPLGTVASEGLLASQGAIRAASTAAPNAATPQPPVTEQVAVQILSAARAGFERISVELQPANLGRVDVELTIAADGRVQAVVTADKSETLDLLQRDAKGLERALQDAGLDADANSLEYSLRGEGDGADEHGTSNALSASEGEDNDPDAIPLALAAQAAPPAGAPGHTVNLVI